ncbi:uncharacterized protein LOC116118286 isoform X2 [Pistacia vera]|uniref:uncharacterized protein LOC116118286 isoform X2 n=1 Tax=Pistacia vera TaxID=55513 RepID=UPI0012633856|nr:uncharacterized protein LOC116118286 isoform X2 [Pistacia vera]
MALAIRSGSLRKPSEMMKIIITTFVGVIFGFFLGISFPTISLTKMNLPSSLIPSIDLTYIEDKYSGLSTQTLLNVWSTLKSNRALLFADRGNQTKIWIPTNPKGAERLPPGIIESESDLFLRRLWGLPSEDLTITPKYLVTFTVGYNQKKNIDAAIKKFSENFTILLFHYDGRTSEWEEFEWSKRAIHVSARKQSKWWYAKRFLHPDIVAPYDYIFIWDEDLGLDHFNAEEYLKLVRKYGLEISQPGLEPNGGLTWEMTKKRDNSEVHKDAKERNGWCGDPHLPPCAAFVEIMATVFSRDAWRCVWHMVQNDLVHGWGLDFALRKCVEPAHEKIGVIDAQWIVHQGVPTLGNQGQAYSGKAPWEGVRERCKREWAMFQDRLTNAEKEYLEELGVDSSNLTADNQKSLTTWCMQSL